MQLVVTDDMAIFSLIFSDRMSLMIKMPIKQGILCMGLIILIL